MTKRLAGLLVAAATLMTPAAARAASYVPDELIVRFKASADAAERRGARAAVGARISHSLALSRTQVVAVDGSPVDAARELAQRPEVAYAHPNYVMRMSAMPNDPRLSELWGLESATGADVDAPAAWNVTTGSDSVRVAVIDSGVDADHPDLVDNIWRNPGEAGTGKESNGIDDDGNGKVDDWRGWDFTDNDNDPHDGAATHGTHVAGTIGAQGNNGIGVAGVSWNVGLIPLRVGRDDGSVVTSAAVDAIAYAGKMGARIANLSFGGGVPAGQPIPQAYLDAMRGAPNTLFVVAAGNDGTDNDKTETAKYPCNFSAEPNVVCVAATDEHDALTDFSNFGPRHVQLAAPGKEILSTQPLAQIHDSFDTVVPGRWKSFSEPIGGFISVAPGRWARTTDTRHSGTHSYTDSPSSWADSWTNSGIALTTPVSTVYDPGADGGTHHCYVDFWWRPRPDRNPLISPMAQNFHIDTLDPTFVMPNAWFDTVTLNLAAFSDSWQHANVVFMPGHLFKDRIMVRLRMDLFGVSAADGVYVDDVKIWCGPPVPPEYKALDGTSMAAPHVAGVAALLAAKSPAMTAAQMKRSLLGSVELKPGLAGKIATGGRLDAARALAYSGPPQTMLTSGPQGDTADSTPTFDFAASDPNVTFECRIDAGAPAPCASPYTTPPLPPGAHTFSVSAIDPAGTADPTPETRAFTVLATGTETVKGPGTPPVVPATLSKLVLKGTTVSFALSQPAQVVFTVERKVRGRKAGSRCARATRKNRRSKPCTRWERVKGSLERAAQAGPNSFRFDGRLAGRRLRAGAYRLSATIGGAPAGSAPFTIKRR